MSTNPLGDQRLLVAALLGAVLLSTALFFALRTRGERPVEERAPPVAPAVSATEVLPVPPGAPGRAGAESERAELASEPARPQGELEGAAEDGFDPGAVYGRVLGSPDSPVAGARVLLLSGRWELREQARPLSEGTTDDAGRYRFAGREPHERFLVLVQAQGFLPETETTFPGHGQEIELEPAATIRGRVFSAATREPLSGVEIALGCEHWGASGFEELARSTSDAQGAWQLPWAEIGIQELLVTRPGCLPERRDFQVSADQAEGYDIYVGAGPELELEVYRLENGTALPETELLANGCRVRTSAAARLVLPLPPGLSEDGFRLTLAGEGWCTTQGRVQPFEGLSLLRVPLSRGATIAGRVVDGDGAPVEGALLRFSGGGRSNSNFESRRASVAPSDFWFNPPREPVRSAPDGRFALTGIPPRDGNAEVRAVHPDYPSARSAPFSFAPGERVEVEIVVTRGGLLHGRVTLDGEPAPLRVYWTGALGSGWTQADDRGEYLCRAVPCGELTVAARLEDEDDEYPRAEDRQVWVEEGARVECDLALASNLAVIAGIVRDELGSPVTGVEVQAAAQSDDDDFEYTASGDTEADGSFELRVASRPGVRYYLAAEDGPRRAFAEDVAPGTSGLELVLPALARLPLRVTDRLHGDPVQGFQLYWRDSEQGVFERLHQGARRFSPGPNGLFVAELPAGRLDLAVAARAQGYAPARLDSIELRPGDESRTIEVALERGVVLELAFELQPGAEPLILSELQRGRVSLSTEEDWADRERGGEYFHQEVRVAQALRIDPQGHARVGSLAPGRYRFFGTPKVVVLHPPLLDIPAVERHAATVRAELRARPGAEDAPQSGSR